MSHWFDGLAMLHRFTIADGRVSYGNRFLESRSYRAAREHGPDRLRRVRDRPVPLAVQARADAVLAESILPDNANVNVAKLGERFIAMTETPLPVQFDPHTLAGRRRAPYEAPGQLTTAHPHMDRATEGMLNYAAKLGPRSSYRFFARSGPDGDGEPRVIASLPVTRAGLHALLRPHRALARARRVPVRRQPARARAVSGRPYIENYRWKPELGTRFTWSTARRGEATGAFETDACFAFHHVNAYEDDDEVVVDLCAYPDAGIVEDLYLERLRDGQARRSGATLDPLPARARRPHRSPASGSPTSDLELPRINYGRCNERPYRYVWGIGTGASGWLEQIVKVDTGDGARPLSGRRTAATRASRCSWRAPGAERRGRRRAAVGRARRRDRAARSCSCSTPATSASSPAPRFRTTSRSASTGSSRAPDVAALALPARS